MERPILFSGPVYPVITLYQPWASLVVSGLKTIETRTHNRFKSLLHKTILIHAGMTFNASGLLRYTGLPTYYRNPAPEDFDFGCILGSVYVDADGWLCGNEHENKSALIECKDRYGLFLKDNKEFKAPIACKGEMGIWYFDIDKGEKVRKPQKQKTFDLK